jgi:hypothetical protein
MSASLIGRLGQALSGYPPTPVSMSLTGCATATPAKGRLIAALCWEAFLKQSFNPVRLAVRPQGKLFNPTFSGRDE